MTRVAAAVLSSVGSDPIDKSLKPDDDGPDAFVAALRVSRATLTQA
jgi:hypothetical protein